MASGRPDWHSIISISGQVDADTFKTLKVDANGQLYIALTGQSIALDPGTIPSDYFKNGENVGALGGIVANVTVDQQDSNRTVKGIDLDTPFAQHIVAVDSAGVILARMKGAFGGVLGDISIDTNGIMLSRMKGAATGEQILAILNDCGDTTDVEDWVEVNDGLNPVENTVFVKQGSKSMALGIDASLSGEDSAQWNNTESKGNLSNYMNDWIYLWIYFPTVDYLVASGTAFRYIIGSSSNHLIRFTATKADLSVGWNLIKCDLDNPSTTKGTIDWTAISYQMMKVDCVSGNPNDFTIYVDSLMFVRPTPGAGTLKDLAVDENGILLAKMTGQYAGMPAKTIAVDQNGVMKANLTTQDLDFLTVRPAYGEAKRVYAQNTNVAALGTATPISESGQGVTLGGIMEWTSALGSEFFGINVYLDDAIAFTAKVSEMLSRRIDIDGISLCILTNHNLDTDNHYVIAFARGYTFENKIEIKFTNIHDATGITIDLTELYFALVP